MKYPITKYRLSLVRESKKAVFNSKESVCNADDVYRVAHPFFKGLDREQLGVIALDTQNHPIGFNVASIDSVESAIVHPREIFKFAILANASAVILIHNHPSGSIVPSPEDIQLTDKVVQCGKLLNITVLDHVIFGDSPISMRIKSTGIEWQSKL